ncbi:MAG: hypothetical protein KKG33_01685 [candidate division Zixibacteria bacterium]|nr:hypothetical protein [candidate division Zixibacteria bacterium]MBU1470384.1 hypothetical protein [candidate division Zixibacteria bacterium]MBU2624250.1 hypothetical protein [candidate division Zixibacteria bacterium]
MEEQRFIEFDKVSGELVINLPADSNELRQIVMSRLQEHLNRKDASDVTLEELERVVAHVLLENSIKVD